MLSNLYNAFILPHLLYCVEIWVNAADCHILPIITLQKKIIRYITFSPYLVHTKNLFLDTNILPFKKLVIHRIGIQMFKFNLGLSPVALNNLFVRNSNIHNYNTRNKNKLRLATVVAKRIRTFCYFIKKRTNESETAKQITKKQLICT